CRPAGVSRTAAISSCSEPFSVDHLPPTCPPRRRVMHDPGQIESQNFFPRVPESGAPGRQSTTGDSVRPPPSLACPAMTPAALRLRAWTEMPERHRDEVCGQIRRRCEAFVASIRVERTARKAEADGLVSEVVAHLLRATSLGRDEPPMNRSQSTAAS